MTNKTMIKTLVRELSSRGLNLSKAVWARDLEKHGVVLRYEGYSPAHGDCPALRYAVISDATVNGQKAVFSRYQEEVEFGKWSASSIGHFTVDFGNGGLANVNFRRR